MAKTPALSLHVPAPPSRPGDAPRFENLRLSAPGAMRRPPVDAAEADLRDMPYGLVRVLDDAGAAVGPWDPGLSPEQLHAALRAMMLTRQFEERMFAAHRQGKTSFFMKSTGEEAIAVALSMALAPDDMCFPTYRMQGWLMARGYPLADMMNQVYSNEQDPIRGRQLPLMYSARDYGFYSLSGNLGNRFVHAVGWAMASAYKGDHRIALGVVGEGTTAEGGFHEGMTFASVYRAPVILAVTNNQWAISGHANLAGGKETTFAAKAIGYAMPGLRVDGNDVLAVWGAACWAAARARANLGPTLIEFFTYRAGAHSTSDDPARYRPAGEGAEWPLGDPIDRLKRHMIARGLWSEERHVQMGAEIADHVRAAQKQAEAIGTLGKSKPPLDEMFEDVFKQPDWRLVEQRRELEC